MVHSLRLPAEDLAPRKKILILNVGIVGQCLSVLFESQGWEVVVAEDASYTAKQDLSAFLVGLIHFHDAQRLSPSQIRAVSRLCVQQHHMNWVAVVRSDCMRLESCRLLVANHFYDYHTLPVDGTRLLITLGRALGINRVIASSLHASSEGHSDYRIVGESELMKTVKRNLNKFAKVDTPILITGKSGTGKELAAEYIHRHSSRKDKPFIAINCGAIPRELVQSELFGYARGAFTGAAASNIGSIEAANGGTIFLDEIGDLARDIQVNLLRFLQENTIKRVGDTNSITIDARIIVATNVDLEEAVGSGDFREDLYYRINILNIEMPTLKDRQYDIELLAHYFFKKFSKSGPTKIRGFSPKVMRDMVNYSWPGNVRQLLNAIKRAMVMCDKRLISSEDLGLNFVDEYLPDCLTLEEAREKAEMDAIEACLKRSGNNLASAAKLLDIARPSMYRLMKKHKIAFNNGKSGESQEVNNELALS